MIKNLLLVALRNFKRDKWYSLLNILGLTIGITFSLFLIFYVQDELSYDRHHEKADRIFRVESYIKEPEKDTLKWVSTPFPLAPALSKDYPEVEEAIRFVGNGNILYKKGELSLYQDKVFFADSNVFRVFTHPFIEGDPQTALVAPNSMVLTQSVAEKYFGKAESYIGKSLENTNGDVYRITGVVKDVPKNSHIIFNALISRSSLPADFANNWGGFGFHTYVLLKPYTNTASFEKKLLPVYDKYLASIFAQYNINIQFGVRSITAIHLHSDMQGEPEELGNISYIYIFSAVAFFMLLIACINYMNLTTARSARRAKEVGMRKVVGAQRAQLIRQFLVESLLFTIIALVVSFALVAITLPFLNSLAGKHLAFTDLMQPAFIGILLVVTLFTALVSGSYPAFFLTAFQPIKVFKGKVATDVKKGILQQLLVTAQFAIAVLLIICTTVVYNQMRHVQDFKLGYSREQVVLMPAAGDSTAFESARQQLIQHTGIVDVARSSRIPTGRLLDGQTAFVMRGSELAPMGAMIKGLAIDEQFIPTYQIEMLAGRNLSREHPSDRTGAFILNESAAKMLGWDDPSDAVGNVFAYGDRKGQIIGVTKDFHFESLHQEVVPLAMGMDGGYAWWSIRRSGGDVSAALFHLESVWKARFPDNPFRYEFLDDRFGALYEKEQTQQVLFSIFAGIAIFISCLGLLGLSMYMAELRMKEIGIRKVLGASVLGIVQLLSKDFLKLVLIAIFIAAPIAWWLMNNWLDDFAYRVTLQWWMFAVAGLVAMIIALATVGWQAIRAAMANPVESLRDE